MNRIPSINVESEVVDLCFHPNSDIIALAHIDGQLDLFSYSVGTECLTVSNFFHHKKACRTVSFSPQGDQLISSSADKSILILDVKSSSKIQHLKLVHDCPIYSLLVIDDNIIASGDDDGFLKIWDLRKTGAIMTIQENDDCLTDMLIDEAKRELLVTSGEGTLTSFDIRKHKMKIQSELFDSGFNSIARIMEDSKVVCGSEQGVLNFFNWGEWGNISDRFPGHSLSVEAIIPLSDHVICTADSDGVRLVHLFPNRFIGIIGTHDDQPVENLSLSRCGKWVASCSHDERVRFWDVATAGDSKVSGKTRASKADKKRVLINGASASGSSNFFDDLIEAEVEGGSKKAKLSNEEEDTPTTSRGEGEDYSEVKDSDSDVVDSEESDDEDSDGADNECDDNAVVGDKKLVKRPNKKMEKKSDKNNDSDDDDDDDDYSDD